MTALYWIVGIGLLLGVAILSARFGWYVGVRDTEERWSEAVKQADAHREWERKRTEGDLK